MRSIARYFAWCSVGFEGAEAGPTWSRARTKESPALVSLIVTRKLTSGGLVVGTALVDRACLGVKDAFLKDLPVARDLEAFVERVGFAHGGMVACEPLIAQSIVFHAIDYAHSLGFEPHRDFQAVFFGRAPQS